jgi:hypothetical protein
MSEAPDAVMAELREKLKSKIDVAKFFTGFITLLIGFLLNGGKLTSAFSKLGIVFLISSLGFCVAAVFTYDHLLTPREYWTALSEEEKEEVSFNKRLLEDMVRSWWRLFVPAVICFGIGFLLVIVHELGLLQMRANLDVAADLLLVGLLVAAVGLPIWFLIAKWPRIRSRELRQR